MKLTAYAFNEDRVKSETASDESYKVPDDVAPAKPRAYVITVGVNAYQNPNWKLGFAVKDARDLSAALQQIQGYEVRMAALAVLLTPIIVLGFAGVASVIPKGTNSILNAGPHGLSEILYAFTSGAANNGSAFGGITVNTPWYDTTIGITVLLGRFFMIIPMLAIAGNLAKKKTVPASAGTFPVTTPLFSLLLVSVIVIVGALTFFPALSLGPVLEHLQMMAGKTF